jgi:hypothetical protein
MRNPVSAFAIRRIMLIALSCRPRDATVSGIWNCAIAFPDEKTRNAMKHVDCDIRFIDLFAGFDWTAMTL